MDYYKKSLELHKKNKGKLELCSKVKIENKDDLSVAYSPGVAAPCLAIKDGANPKEYSSAKNTVAVISDGSAVLGLGNIGPVAGLPVMEGKAVLFKEFAGLDAFPIVLDTQDTEEIIQTIKNIAPTFGAINLEDISAPRCFDIEERLINELNIPVFHDDQHGTAIVVLAGLINAMQITNKNPDTSKVIINGSGAAGIAITRLLYRYGFKNITLIDSGGIVSKCRADLNTAQKKVMECCTMANICGNLKDVIMGADIFIGVSVGNVLTEEMAASMAKNSIIFALANPEPEISPEKALAAGAAIVATGRSDYPNQVNNVLVFPGIFKGALEHGVTKITPEMKISAAKALASVVKSPTQDMIIPEPFNKEATEAVANAVR